MKRVLLLSALISLLTSPLQANPHQEVGSAQRDASPCGATLLQLEELTGYWSRMWAAEYKEFNQQEVTHFLAQQNITRTDIVGVRVFKSDKHKDYALTVYTTNVTLLEGEVLVKMDCVLPLNSTPGMVLMPESFEELMGKTYEEIGQ